MNIDIEKLYNEFYKIRDKGYIKSINNDTSGIGLTFEKLLGKENENFSLPDYYGIELKTKLSYSKKAIYLFSLAPYGNSFNENKRLWEEYGYSKSKDSKTFYITVTTKRIKERGNNGFLLYINYKKKQLELHIFNEKNELIDDSTYWEFNRLQLSLERKFQYLALIHVMKKKINNDKYYKYYDLNMYKLKSFNAFLEMIQRGKITVSFCVDTFKGNYKYGEMHDHGTKFGIYEQDLCELFYKL